MELARYTGLMNWVPRVGDIIIKSGWFRRVKWFGVINSVDKDGALCILTEASMLLLVTAPPSLLIQKNKQILSRSEIANSFKGTYAVMQHDPKGVPIWYV